MVRVTGSDTIPGSFLCARTLEKLAADPSLPVTNREVTQFGCSYADSFARIGGHL